ncbi:unnamed protein product, partial [Ixodes pacificus]
MKSMRVWPMMIQTSTLACPAPSTTQACFPPHPRVNHQFHGAAHTRRRRVNGTKTKKTMWVSTCCQECMIRQILSRNRLAAPNVQVAATVQTTSISTLESPSYNHCLFRSPRGNLYLDKQNALPPNSSPSFP